MNFEKLRPKKLDEELLLTMVISPDLNQVVCDYDNCSNRAGYEMCYREGFELCRSYEGEPKGI